MRFAYADPPYLGYGAFYADRHPNALDWDRPETHRDLIDRLCTEYPDGWALSMTSGNLHDILPMAPKKARVGAWVKPFCSFKKNVSPAYAWEPVLFMGGRKHKTSQPTVRDWVAESITLKRGLTGAKPRGFCRWIFELLNAQKGDSLDDLFPGSGAVSIAWSEWVGEQTAQMTWGEMWAPPADFSQEPPHKTIDRNSWPRHQQEARDADPRPSEEIVREMRSEWPDHSDKPDMREKNGNQPR